MIISLVDQLNQLNHFQQEKVFLKLIKIIYIISLF